MGFMRGRVEHAGNRNYFGTQNIQLAQTHPIHAALSRIAKVRAASPALQRGLQWNLEIGGERAAFYRVIERDDFGEIALVLLNKGDAAESFSIVQHLQPGSWREALSGRVLQLPAGAPLQDQVPAHGVAVWIRQGPIEDRAWAEQLRARMPRAE
jgi:cyclomaltodextrin glucanotransferase